MTKTLNELAVIMANIFEKDYIKDGGFDNFKDMARCYCYESQDIKDEILNNMKDYSNDFDDEGNYMGRDAEHETDGFIPYRRFVKMVYAELKNRSLYDYE